jgi:PKD repeat protein
MLRSKHLLFSIALTVVLAVTLTGCTQIFGVLPGFARGVGVGLDASPNPIRLTPSQDGMFFRVVTNFTSTPLGPIIATSNVPWITLEDCITPEDNCRPLSPGLEVVVPVFISFTVDRTKTNIGQNEGIISLNAEGASTEEVVVTLNDFLQVDFEADLRAIPVGGTVTFSDRTFVTETSGDIVSYVWDWGDGSDVTVGDSNPEHVYDAPGLYTVSLSVSTTDGSIETRVREAFIAVGTPLVDAAFTTELGETVVFEGDEVTFVYQPASEGVTVLSWDFGDGSFAQGSGAKGIEPITQTHTYDSPGVYTVSLTVDTDFGPRTFVEENFIVVRCKVGPTADFVIASAEPHIAGAPVYFRDLSEAGTGTLSWEWDFDDGSEIVTDRDPVHIFPSPDGDSAVHFVKLTVRTEHSGEAGSTWTRSITIIRAAPVADFSVDNMTPAVDETIVFTDLSVPGSDPISGWLWDFGDGTTSTDVSPTHSYAAEGCYDVSLTVSTDGGQESFLRKIELVSVDVPPVAAFVATVQPGLDKETVVVSNTSTPGSLVNPCTNEAVAVTYTWNFGDDTLPVSTNGLESVSHSYDLEGTYMITLTASNGRRTSEVSEEVVITFDPPVPSFTVSPSTNVSIGDQVTFTNTTTLGTEEAISYGWNFGDNTFGFNVESTTHTYFDSGEYDVVLIAETNNFPEIISPSVKVTVTDTFRLDSIAPEFGVIAGGNDVDLIGAFPVAAAFTSATAASAAYVVYFGDMNDASRMATFNSSSRIVIDETTMHVTAPPSPDGGVGAVVDVKIVEIDDKGEMIDSTNTMPYIYTDFDLSVGLIKVSSATDVADGDMRSLDFLRDMPGEDGVISLREAITAANASAAGNAFIAVTQSVTIRPVEALPELSGELATMAILGFGNLVLDGTTAEAGVSGLVITTSGHLVDGVSIVNFPAHGIQLLGAGASGNTVTSSSIGTGGSNIGSGVFVSEGASNNFIGLDNQGNTISANVGDGVLISGGTTLGNTLSENAIFNNAGLAISLEDGGNANFPSPEILSVDVGGGGRITVTGTALVGTVVELFGMDVDAFTGAELLQTYLRSSDTVLDGTFSISAPALASGTLLSVTATNITSGNTSVYSASMPVP